MWKAFSLKFSDTVNVKSDIYVGDNTEIYEASEVIKPDQAGH